MAERQTPSQAREENRITRRATDAGFGMSPFRGLQRFADEVDRLFEDFGLSHRRFGSPVWGSTLTEAWAPSIEVFQKNNELTVRADLPGTKREDVALEITDDALTIRGERRRERDEEREGYYRSERRYGIFSRVIPLPEGAITEQAKATFRDGVVEITMPAPPASKGRRLEIAEAKK